MVSRQQLFQALLTKNAARVKPLLDFNQGSDRLFNFDLTEKNEALKDVDLEDTNQFSSWIDHQLEASGSRYGIGGYNEHRTIYKRSKLFDSADEPRRLHLGVDLWGKEGTGIFCPLEAKVHSFAYNDHYGDYGATILLVHELDGLIFHSLYGHLSLHSLDGLYAGREVSPGEPFCWFGGIDENGHWPPHLHFQLIFDMEGHEGDYPGVCQYSKREHYLKNCPDPNLILRYTFK